MHPYRRLVVWQKAHQLAIAVRTAFARCAASDIAAQVRRSSASIPTNIVEGAGSQTNGMFVRFLGIALASAQETEYLLLLARDTGHLSTSNQEQLDVQCAEVQGMLCGLIAAVRRGAMAGAAATPGRIRRPLAPNKQTVEPPANEKG
ncbi:MAG: four helix bundle protein [Gemmatimonadota bacterium]